jgi:hypothetical protein
MRLEVTVDGASAEYEIDVGLDSMTMNDLIVLERTVGKQTIIDLQAGHVSFEAQKAIIWLKLRDQIPGLKMDASWDIPLAALADAWSEPDEDEDEDEDSSNDPSVDDLEAELFAGATPTSPKV